MRKALLCTTNEQYVDAFQIFESSLLANNIIDYDLILVTDADLSIETQFTVVKVESQPIESVQFDDITARGMSLLIIGLDEIKAQYDRIVAIDVDTIINGDISHLFEMEIDGIGAHRDMYIDPEDSNSLIKASRGLGKTEVLRRAAISPNHEYFNSGVLVFDTTKIVNINLYSDFLEKVSRFRFPDQDYLNEIFDSFTDIGYEYNSYVDQFGNGYFKGNADILKRRARIEAGKIIHINTGVKPWSPNFAKSFDCTVCALSNILMQFPMDLYAKYASASHASDVCKAAVIENELVQNEILEEWSEKS